MKSKIFLKSINAEFFEDFESLNEFLLELQVLKDYELPGIHFAAENGAIDIVKRLLYFNSELLNSKDSAGQSALLWASANGHLKLVRYLLELRADTSISTFRLGHKDHNISPLHWAVINGHPDVVLCLLKFGAKSNIGIGKGHRYPIHHACKHGHLNIVKKLIQFNPNSIEYKDIYGKTPLMHAASKGHTHIVRYLLSLDADLDACTNSHKNRALNLALANKQYEAANLLILKQMHQQEDANILPFIESGLQAILLMIEKPNLIPLLNSNERISNLIQYEESNQVEIQPNAIHFYKTAGRRKSFYARINSNDNTLSVFKPVKKLGSGSFADVRLFQDDNNESAAIKSPISGTNSLSTKNKNRINKLIIKEAQFYARAYPNKDKPKICTFSLFGKNNKDYTYRYVMPFNAGKHAHEVIAETSNVYELALLILRIAEELHRIHMVGILHRDIYEKNILVLKLENNFVVHIVDFGFSCDLSNATVDIFIHKNVSDNRWYAPEVCSTSEDNIPVIEPHPRQDVYSLGYFLTNHIFNQELLNLFPSIKTFMSLSQTTIPENRPTLESFCHLLEIDLHINQHLNTPISESSSFKKY